MAVPYTFGTATASIPLSQIDSNFATVITLGNTAIQLGNTVTTLNNMTLANVTINSGNVTLTNVAVTTANVTTANITTAVIGTETVTTSTITTANVTTANITTNNITNGTVITSLTLSYGTANGVAYLNGSKVITTGSALTFDGTNFATTGTATATKLIPTGSSATGNGMYLPATNALGFSTNGTNAVYIDASQNVGIGTSSPAQKLDVSGAVNSVQTRFGNVAGRGLEISTALVSGVNDGGSVLNAKGASSGTLIFQTDTTERMRIDSSGNVGIGATSPGLSLDIQTSTAGARVYPSTTTNNAYWRSQNAGGTAYLGLDNSAGGLTTAYALNVFHNGAYPIVFGTNNTERMRISSTGVVTMSAYGAGTATFSASGVISSISDETWKIKDGIPVDPDSMLKKLEPGYWYYNDEKKEIFGVDRQLGFYAQNVNAALGPEAAPTPEEGKPWGYYDRSVLAVTVMSLQKALATIESLTARIEALEAK